MSLFCIFRRPQRRAGRRRYPHLADQVATRRQDAEDVAAPGDEGRRTPRRAEKKKKKPDCCLERELRESEERYRFLVENSPDVIYATDADGKITYFSESVERVLGWVPQEVVGRHFRDIVRTPDGIPAGRRFAELAAVRPRSRPAWSCRTRTAPSASSR